MGGVVLIMGIVVGVPQAEKEVTTAEKTAFLELFASLSTDGEFFTDEAVEKAVPHTRVLLALSKKDVERHDLYPFLALSRGLLSRKDQREYGMMHFDKIAHPEIKLFWGAVLFNEKAHSSAIIRFLRTALESREQSRILSEMLGSDFEDFKKRVKEYPVKEK